MRHFPKHGLNVPLITILDEAGQVIAADQRRVIRHVWQEGYGADVIFANGTTGEWNRLANSERQRLLEIAVDEVKCIRQQAAVHVGPLPEIWLGVNGATRAEVLSNLDLAIQLGADADVIAPLAIDDLADTDIPGFFRRELNDLLETARPPLPIFLYDNADINALSRDKTQAHIGAQVMRELSRLPWVCGLKVSAPRHILEQYAQAVLPFKQPGEFGLYVGNANLIFDWFRPCEGRLASGHIPVGVVAGPANVLPREWQKAWRVCQAGDEELIGLYQEIAAAFERLTVFNSMDQANQDTGKMIACLKTALALDGLISADGVALGTPRLTESERTRFQQGYAELKNTISGRIAPRWQTITALPKAARRPQNALSELSLQT